MAFQSSGRGKRLVLTEVLVLVIFLGIGTFSCTSKKSKDQYPVSKEPGGLPDPVLVKKLFDVKCALCHGFDGRQSYAGAKNLGLSDLQRNEVVTRINEGKGAMPPQKDVLSEEQVSALADFVFTLRTN